MAKTTLTGPRGELVIEREVIPVHYLSDINADWEFTDAAGHRHHCAYKAADHYPTLIRVTYETYWCGECDDEHELAHLECRQCGEVIRPGTTGPGTKYIPGLLTCTLDGELITQEQAMALAAEWGNHG
jgi:hypothetical protein